MSDVYDLITEIRDNTISMQLVPSLWKKIDKGIFELIHSARWTTFKFYGPDQSRSLEVGKISNTKGGIYIFFIDPGIISGQQKILTYVGRAENTKSQNLRKRIREYYGYMPPDTRRVKIGRMLKNWWEFLYCSYIELTDNKIIDSIESELINVLLPPMNDTRPDIKIAAASKAAF